MSMLAEPRSRQKWSHDPRNTNWSNDKTKFGYQMLTKMGWSEGNGLGLNLSGNVSHIKVNKRGSNAGVGLKKSHEDDWIGHQDDFNALLNSLNGNPASETATPVEKMKATRHRYTKFVKSKDLSNASNDDLACIFGQRGKSTAGGATEEPADDSDGSQTPEAVEEEQDNIKTVESTLSMSEYFAKKMAALKQKSVVANSPICTSNIAKVTVDNQKIEEVENKETGDCGKAKKKKRKKKEEEENLVPEEEVSMENCEPVKKKKKKKSSCDDCEIQVPSPCTELKDDSNELEGAICDVTEKKKKKKKVKESEEESPIPSPLSEPTTDVVDSEIVTKKKKKKKKSKENDDVESPVPSPCPETENDCVESKKKKKKKEKSAACNGDENVEPCKEIDNNQENESLLIEAKPEKKKKRKGTGDTEKDIEKQSTEQTDEGAKKKKKKRKNREEISSEESNQ